MGVRFRVGASAIALLLCIVLIGCGRGNPRPEAAALGELGARLLGERRLAAAGARSCLDCHRPERGYSDGRASALPGGLNTPPLWGLAGRRRFGWFSPEVTTLEAQVLRPLSDPREMGPRQEATLARLRADADLRAAYARAFPGAAELVTWEQTAAALAAAVRAIPTPPAAYDRYAAGDQAALSPAARRGMVLFGELGCASCHQGAAFASDTYHSVGVPAAQNGGRARVPSLRGVRLTGPYFHDGSALTLAEVVRAYARGGQRPDTPTSPAITPLQLSEQDILDLVAFLEAL